MATWQEKQITSVTWPNWPKLKENLQTWAYWYSLSKFKIRETSWSLSRKRGKWKYSEKTPCGTCSSSWHSRNQTHNLSVCPDCLKCRGELSLRPWSPSWNWNSRSFLCRLCVCVFFSPRAPEHFIYSVQQTGNVVSFSEWAAEGENTLLPPHPLPLHWLRVPLRTGDAGRLGDQCSSRGQHTDQQQGEEKPRLLSIPNWPPAPKWQQCDETPAPPHRPDTPPCMILFSDTPQTATFSDGFLSSGFRTVCVLSGTLCIEINPAGAPVHPATRSLGPRPLSPTPTLYCCCRPENQVQWAQTTQAAKLIPP